MYKIIKPQFNAYELQSQKGAVCNVYSTSVASLDDF